MRYVVKTVLGLGLMAAAITACSYAVAELLQVGTCASGGPYQIARECPAGTERLVIAIFPAVMVMLGGGWIYATRGSPPGSQREGEGASALLVIWCGLFLGIAFACFWAVWGPDANPGPGGKLGGLIVGFIFAPMGLLPLIAALFAWRGGRSPPAAGPTATAAGGSLRAPSLRRAAGSGDKLSRLERLNELRSTGALTDAEFERLKAEILGS